MSELVSRQTIEQHCGIPMPEMKDVRRMLRYNFAASVREKVLGAFIIGSTAKLNTHSDSDIDIAVIIPTKARKSALKFTEHYHQKFSKNSEMPQWEGRRVDFQFYYCDAGLSEFNRMDCSL